jgi:hypothetical protein
MKSWCLALLVLCVYLSTTYTISGCGDDDAQGTCESACNRILNCADAFGIDPGDFAVQQCNADCGMQSPGTVACAEGCDAAPNCVAYAACLVRSGV